MELKVLGSSSSGNCYILECGSEALIIEAGISFINVKKALGFNLRKVVGCLVTHQHNDHAKYLKTMCDHGFRTLALPEVYEGKGCWGNRSMIAEVKKRYTLGNFKVMPFPACHDVPCIGYLIQHPECGRVMFLTDSFMCEYTFPGLDQIMIECNYSDARLIQAIQEGRTKLSQRERLMTSHLELESCKGILKANDLSKVCNVVLLHLSDNNSDEEQFVNEIQGSTGKPVYAARPGMTIEFNKDL